MTCGWILLQARACSVRSTTDLRHVAAAEIQQTLHGSSSRSVLKKWNWVATRIQTMLRSRSALVQCMVSHSNIICIQPTGSMLLVPSMPTHIKTSLQSRQCSTDCDHGPVACGGNRDSEDAPRIFVTIGPRSLASGCQASGDLQEVLLHGWAFLPRARSSRIVTSKAGGFTDAFRNGRGHLSRAALIRRRSASNRTRQRPRQPTGATPNAAHGLSQATATTVLSLTTPNNGASE